MYYYKLTELELCELVNRGLISQLSCDNIRYAATQRKPGEFANDLRAADLNKAGTIKVQNVHYYGGEHFGEPYYFIAEIYHTTTEQAFSAWANRNKWLKLRSPFTY